MNKSTRYVRYAYESLLDMVFPRWKAGPQWIVKVGQRARYSCEHGFCEADEKVIWVSERAADKDQELRLVLVHEIVHAIAGPGHGKKFCRRLGDAAQMAKKKGDHQLAHDLQAEQESYENTPAVRAADVYGRICDAAIEAPSSSFEAVECGVAQDYGLTVEELRRKYRRCRGEWEDVRKRAGFDRHF